GGVPSDLVEAINASVWRSPVMLGRPMALAEWFGMHPEGASGYDRLPATLFLHVMHTVSGERRLVLIELSVQQILNEKQAAAYSLETRRTFYSRVYDAATRKPIAVTA